MGDARRRADQGHTEGENLRATVRSEEKAPHTGPFLCLLPASVAAVERNIDKTEGTRHFDLSRILETWKFHAHE
jgi:hypothetical protein